MPREELIRLLQEVRIIIPKIKYFLFMLMRQLRDTSLRFKLSDAWFEVVIVF